MNKRDFIRGIGVGVLATSIVVGGFSLAGLDRTKNSQNEGNKNHIASETPLNDQEGTEAPMDTAEPAQTADVTEKPSQSPAPAFGTEAPKNTQTPGTSAPDATKAPGSGQSSGGSQGSAPSAGQSGTSDSSQGSAPSAGQSGTSDSSQGSAPSAGQSGTSGGSQTAAQNQNGAPEENYTLEIPRGADSYTVASKLEDAGVVSSAREFDDYLVERGYSEKLAQGSFEISKNDTYDQIARKITGRVK